MCESVAKWANDNSGMKISFECYASKQSYQALSTRLTCNILLFVLHRSLLAESLCSTFVCSMPLFAVVLYFSIVLYKTILFTKNLHFFYFSVHILFFIFFFIYFSCFFVFCLSSSQLFFSCFCLHCFSLIRQRCVA